MDIQSLPQSLIHALAKAHLHWIQRAANGVNDLPVVPDPAITADTALSLLAQHPDPYVWTALQHVEFAQALRQPAPAAPTLESKPALERA